MTGRDEDPELSRRAGVTGDVRSVRRCPECPEMSRVSGDSGFPGETGNPEFSELSLLFQDSTLSVVLNAVVDNDQLTVLNHLNRSNGSVEVVKSGRI